MTPGQVSRGDRHKPISIPNRGTSHAIKYASTAVRPARCARLLPGPARRLVDHRPAPATSAPHSCQAARRSWAGGGQRWAAWFTRPPGRRPKRLAMTAPWRHVVACTFTRD